MDRINYHIAKGSSELDIQDALLIDALLKRYKETPQYSAITSAYRYYHNQNDINFSKEKKLKVIKSQHGGRLDHGTLTKLGTSTDYLSHEDVNSVDAVSHPFMRDIVDEKVDYLFSRPFTIKADNETYLKLLNDTFDKKLRNIITESVRECINSGVAWVNAYFVDNQLHFKLIPTKQLYPVYDDETGQLLNMLHFYYRDVFIKQGQEVEIKAQEHIDLYDNTFKYTYVRDLNTNKLQAYGEPTPLLLLNNQPMQLKTIPFVKLQYNEFEEPLLVLLKSLIDDYDKTISNGSKTIRKLTENILVLKKMGGTNLEQVLEYLDKYGVLKAQGDGEVDILTQSADSLESLLSHANNTKANIYKFSKAVDINSLEGKDLSGVALKLLYTALNLDVGHIEENLLETLEELLYFVDLYYELTNKGSYYNEVVNFVFHREEVINDSEHTDKLISLLDNNLISRKTCMEKLGIDIEIELQRLQEQGE